MNDEDKENMLASLVDATRHKDAVYQFDGPQMATVKLKDNTFRRKTIARQNFFLENIYVGKKNTVFVLCLEEAPDVSGEEYVCIEVNAKDMDDAFPMFLDDMRAWATDRFVATKSGVDAESRIQSIAKAETVVGLLTLSLDFEEQDLEVETMSLSDQLASNPNFGIF